MNKKRLFFVLTCVFLILPVVAAAKIGVGIGTGKIQMSDLKAGGIYEVQSLSIINTGDEASDYEIGIAYNINQPEKRPEREWFQFSPQLFNLVPGAGQIVEVRLKLPVKTEPGDYFAYLEAKPVMGPSEPGIARVGVAAAAKFNFTVVPSSLWQALLYRASTIWKNYAPWSYIVSIVVILSSVFMIITLVLKRYFHFELNVRKRQE